MLDSLLSVVPHRDIGAALRTVAGPLTTGGLHRREGLSRRARVRALHEHRIALLRREARRRVEAELAADDVRPAHQRHHLVERVHPAHALPTEAAIAAEDQPLRLDEPERLADER